MLGWVVLALLGGGAALARPDKKALRGGSAKDPSVSFEDREAAFQKREAQWRAQWSHLVPEDGWIPSRAAARVLAEFPRPQKFTHTFGSFFGGDPALEELKREFAARNQAFAAKQRERLKTFFGTVEKAPLTDEQIDACICMDDSVQIVAAAGSGKTSIMVAKAAYAMHESLAQPGEILLLAFNADAAAELRSRLIERLSDVPGIENVTAKTFHSFGLDVIAAAKGKKPRLAPWVEKPGEDLRMIVEIAETLSSRDASFRRDWDLYRTVFGRDVGRWDRPAQPEAYEKGRRGFRTANGEIVKSKEERRIADWLFRHGVSYEYEREYEHDTATERHRQYCPDFYYPEIGLYHEHFALNERGEAPSHFSGDYVAGVAWKRQVHADNGTKLFETKSFELADGTALQRLETELVSHGVELNFDPSRPSVGPAPLSNAELAATLRVFQQHVKGNGLSRDQLHDALERHAKTGDRKRLSLFVSLYERISEEWEKRLQAANCIDFDDMLLLATEHIESRRYKSPFKILLADEFQDSSRMRMRLLKALSQARGEPSHLCVVGDDWQGINRFAGADIAVMSEFENVFPDATRLTLGTTFRCPQSLCDVSSAFVQANPAQIRKDVKSISAFEKTSLMAFAFNNPEKASAHLEDQLALMQRYIREGRLAPERGDKVSVLLLGRYRSDRPARLTNWQRRFGDCLQIDFRTVHSSKGLEAEYVMILNMVEDTRGFPCQIEDDPVLQIPMPTPDSYPLAEERRLFYVALTRARKQVRIYTSLGHPSSFLVELASRKALEIEAVDGEALEPCPRCAVGVVRTKNGKHGAFQTCSTFPRCDFKRNLRELADPEQAPAVRLARPVQVGSTCPTCGEGSMEIAEGPYGQFVGCSAFPDCRTTAKLH